MRRSLVGILAATVVAMAAPTAYALPSEDPDGTWQTNGKVRAVEVVGGNVWIAGAFTQVLSPSGSQSRSVSNLAVFDGVTGVPVGFDVPRVTGSGSIVYDLSFDGSIVWLGGKFSSVGGANRRNIAGVTPTGDVTRFSVGSPQVKSVFSNGSHVFGGGRVLESYTLSGSKTGGFDPPRAGIDDSLRAHATAPSFRDIVQAGGDLVVACQCDSINGRPSKAAAKIDADTGAVSDWRPRGLDDNSAAFGIGVAVSGGTVYLAAGGSDFAAAYSLASGAQDWHTDTNGSSQVVELFSDGNLIVGGHFTYVSDGSPEQCPTRNQDPGGCFDQPRLVALNPANGNPITSWTPGICCKYNGVWALATQGLALHIGGEFTKVSGQGQDFYAKLSLVDAI